jgi:hypothetical protein
MELRFAKECPAILDKDACPGQRFCHMQQALKQRWRVFCFGYPQVISRMKLFDGGCFCTGPVGEVPGAPTSLYLLSSASRLRASCP